MDEIDHHNLRSNLDEYPEMPLRPGKTTVFRHTRPQQSLATLGKHAPVGDRIPLECVAVSSLQTRLSWIGTKGVCRARAFTFQPAAVAVHGDLFAHIIAAIHRRRSPLVST